jgi:hypothetical protein
VREGLGRRPGGDRGRMCRGLVFGLLSEGVWALVRPLWLWGKVFGRRRKVWVGVAEGKVLDNFLSKRPHFSACRDFGDFDDSFHSCSRTGRLPIPH